MLESRPEPQIKQTCFIFKCNFHIPPLHDPLYFFSSTIHYCSKVAISFLLSCRRISGLAEAGNDGNGTLRLAGNQLCPRPEATEIELLLDDTSTFSWGIHVNFARQKKRKRKDLKNTTILPLYNGLKFFLRNQSHLHTWAPMVPNVLALWVLRGKGACRKSTLSLAGSYGNRTFARRH